MSTGADCTYVERQPGKWYYELQCYPYGETEDYDKEGPFPTFEAAEEHLHAHNANPGGFDKFPFAPSQADRRATGSVVSPPPGGWTK